MSSLPIIQPKCGNCESYKMLNGRAQCMRLFGKKVKAKDCCTFWHPRTKVDVDNYRVAADYWEEHGDVNSAELLRRKANYEEYFIMKRKIGHLTDDIPF